MTGDVATGADPLIQVGRDLAYCWKTINEISRQESALYKKSRDPEAVGEKTRLEADGRSLNDRIEALHPMASELRATSLQGVMVQICVAATFRGYCQDSQHNDEGQRDTDFRRIWKLLYSMLAHLESETKVSREELMGTVYMFRVQDPQRCLAGDAPKLAS